MPKRSEETLLNLPETKSASKAAQLKLNALLKEALSLKLLEKRQREVKEEIRALIEQQGMQADDGTVGCRNGHQCVIMRWQQGRESLSRELLIENGVLPDVLDKSTKRGEPYAVLEFQEIGQ